MNTIEDVERTQADLDELYREVASRTISSSPLLDILSSLDEVVATLRKMALSLANERRAD